jgi:hypothetical protein
VRNLKLLAVLGLGLLFAPYAHAAQVSVDVGVGAPVYAGPPPVCTYGYYDSYPYACAPYGYYGPSWFSGGVFIGAGPWFHGFHGRPAFHPAPGRFDHGFVGAHPAFRGQANGRTFNSHPSGRSGFRGSGRR